MSFQERLHGLDGESNFRQTLFPSTARAQKESAMAHCEESDGGGDHHDNKLGMFLGFVFFEQTSAPTQSPFCYCLSNLPYVPGKDNDHTGHSCLTLPLWWAWGIHLATGGFFYLNPCSYIPCMIISLLFQSQQPRPLAERRYFWVILAVGDTEVEGLLQATRQSELGYCLLMYLWSPSGRALL